MGMVGRSIDWLIGGPRVGGAAEARLGGWLARPPVDLARPHERVRCVALDADAPAPGQRGSRPPALGAVAVHGRRIVVGDVFVATPPLEGVPDPDGAAVVDTVLGFLEWSGKSPLVIYGDGLAPAPFEHALTELFGVPIAFDWLDLALLLPALVPGTANVSRADWLAHVGLADDGHEPAPIRAFGTARLYLVALAAATAAGIESPAQLLKLREG